ncbi:MAG TPA: thiamine pyrophosphate-dependent dehydrogenase E1 component subunit alpha [Thermoanaerobaculales bacterium]|nr:thiamine pyrophosphate-dependent dehydrogenase E1 component subunit alpha [Thermoanaerobaculales bacterium]HQL31493.1 thiamine pyrophosphate-dependent dehydrogenase E1 component subunit alpha [Thermoanaerobaculales bacterium]
MKPDLLRLYRMMRTSRRLEEEIARLWREGLISGEMHLGIGEEGIVAGVLDHLAEGDGVAADHRSTPPMVMRGVDLAAIVAECLGAAGGLGRGLGGHMHLFSKEHLAASSGIVGSSGPLACGFALAHQQLRPDRVAVAFFGEGAMNQGMLLECLNLAGSWRLPVLFVCKDNGMAITTRSARVTSGNLPDRVHGFGLPAVEVDGADVEAVWQAAGEAVLRARRGGGPGYLHAACVHPEGHFLGDPLRRLVRHPVDELKDKVGPLARAVTAAAGAGVADRVSSLTCITGMVGRAAAERGRDPVERLRGRLRVAAGELEAIEREVEAAVKAAVRAALESLEEVPA